MATTDFTERRAAFRKLHESGCFVIPNPWDVGTARYLRHLGFQALATTSAGFAFSRGLPDAGVPRDLVLSHIAEIVSSVDLPVNADFESGYAQEPEGVAESVRLCVATGVAGLSIEDSTGDRLKPLYDLPIAVERMQAARAAIGASGVLLIGRSECFLTGHAEPLKEAIRRLQAYAEAGADVLYAPGVRERADIRAIVSAVSPKPVNVLMSANTGLKVADLAEMGVRRISVGSSLARAAWGGFIRAAQEIASAGSFAGFDSLASARRAERFFPGRSKGALTSSRAKGTENDARRQIRRNYQARPGNAGGRRARNRSEDGGTNDAGERYWAGARHRGLELPLVRRGTRDAGSRHDVQRDADVRGALDSARGPASLSGGADSRRLRARLGLDQHAGRTPRLGHAASGARLQGVCARPARAGTQSLSSVGARVLRQGSADV